ncbi:MAG TPA: DUF1028 domain-containing protein [Rhizomicrobium sp.]
MTWSIVAFDPKTGAFGAAVTTKAFASGAFMIFARAGVGAVGTQSLTNPYLGPAVLDGLARGLSPRLAIDSALAGDEGREVRQLHAVDARGRVAGWTGRHCVEWAGHVGGDGVSVAGNMMQNECVVPETLAGFLAAREAPLQERLLRGLERGNAAGGDRRGISSAALVSVTAEDFPTCNLRVDDHPQPLGELRRLLGIWQRDREPHLGNSPSKANPAGVHDLDAVEANWAKQGLNLRFRR